MPVVRFSRRAEADLLEIGAFTLSTWGAGQASSYLDALQACCEQLAEAPLLGKACNEIRPGLFRFQHSRHVLFYRVVPEGVLISRILHQRMQLERHEMDDPT